MKKLMLGVAILCLAGNDPIAQEAAKDGIARALTFHASFDGGTDADFAAGDRKLFTATSYRKREDAAPGLASPDVAVARGRGRFGDALHFRKKNTRAIYYQAAGNVAFSPGGWSGTVSFWLSLDPDRDLEPGYCDPVQITDTDYNDAAVWVDFTKDERPRHFRLGVFGDLQAWNPKGIGPDENPDFARRLVRVTKPPFRAGEWTHVVVTFRDLGTSRGMASLYLNGQLQGKTETIREPFTWDVSRAAVRLGLNYVGLYDDLALFNRELSDREVAALYRLEKGAGALHR